MAPYAPGRQPAPGTKGIKLNTNENPYPPSPRGLEVLGQIDGERLRRYPHPRAAEFQRAVADVLNIDPNWVLPANGSDDLLTILMRATAGPGRVVVYPSPTYVLYRTLAAIQDAPVVEVPFDADYALPVQELLAAQGTLTIVANPNSPSGTAASVAELAELATTLEGLLVVDEAYVAFADRDALELTKDHDNVVILRTLSKSHGLAGLRLGFAIAQPPIIDTLVKVKDSYNVDTIAMHVGAAALIDIDYTQRVVERIKISRHQLTETLQRLGCRVWPSQANFVLVRPPGNNANEIYQQLEARGILVRYFAEPALSDTLRISIGTEAELEALVEALQLILPAPQNIR